MPLRTWNRLFLLPAAALAALTGCASAGPYNHARKYVPLSAEDRYLDEEKPISYEEVKRDPNGYKGVEIGWFGVVNDVAELPDGRVRLGLSLRAHQERHLCMDEHEDSCRLTVSEKELGPFSADLMLTPDEKEGRTRLWVGSLIKVYGSPTGDYDDEGGPIIASTYHRHWPRGYYVTTAQRGAMRR